MDRLYTPWRYKYVTGQEEEEGCVFCNRLECVEEEHYILHRAEYWYVVLNLYPYTNGHLLLVLGRHHQTLAGCTADEMKEMGLLLRALEDTLRRAYGPHGINCGYNGGTSAGAGIPEHLHLHIMPRWHGDTNFMTTIGQTRIMPEKLADSHARLKPVLAEVLAGGE